MIAPPPSVVAASLSAPPAPELGFKGATLGISLADWKALPFPDRTPGVVSPVCSDDAAAAARAGLEPSADEAGMGVVLCTYVTGRAEGLDLRQPVALDRGYFARQVVYAFRGGRLESIRYRASIDAFDDVVARLKAEAGAPATVRRDVTRTRFGQALARVRMDWRTPTTTVELTDPSTRADQLSVALTAVSPAPAPR